MRVAAHGFNMKTNIFAIFLQHFAKIHTEWLHDHAQMLFVIEMTIHTHAMIAIIGICVVEFL